MVIFNEILFREAMRDVLEETLNLQDVVSRYYSDTEIEKIELALLSDPTTKHIAYHTGGSIDISSSVKGKYFTWLMKQIERYYDDRFCWEDDITSAIEIFEKAKSLHYGGINPDINTYDLQGFIDTMNGIDPNELQNHTERENQYTIVYDSPEWMVVIPNTYEASRHFGVGTSWCTAAGKNGHNNGKHMFDAYNEDYTLFINIDKNSNKKYQFAVSREEGKDSNTWGEFRDEEDVNILSDNEKTDVIPSKIGMPNGAVMWYKRNVPGLF